MISLQSSYTVLTAPLMVNGFPVLSINLVESLPEGTYILPTIWGPYKSYPHILYIQDSTSNYRTTSGSITFLTNDKINDQVIGTFNIKLTDALDSTNTLNLTEGQFNS